MTWAEGIQLIFAGATLVTAIGALVLGVLNRGSISDVHVAINSRMDELLRVSGIAKKAEGAKEEREARFPTVPPQSTDGSP
jgi:hypothetical protein